MITELRTPGSGKLLFSSEELMCKKTHEVRLHPEFADALVLLRMEYGKPMRVTSCCRSEVHNAEIGGHPRSLHVWDRPYYRGLHGTAAIDVAVVDATERHALMIIALQQGWSVRLYSAHLHLDLRRVISLPNKVTF